MRDPPEGGVSTVQGPGRDLWEVELPLRQCERAESRSAACFHGSAVIITQIITHDGLNILPFRLCVMCDSSNEFIKLFQVSILFLTGQAI